MAAQPTWRKYARRFWSLGYSRVFMILGVLFCLLALATPIWSYTHQEGGSTWHTSNYGWLGETTDQYTQSVYDGSTYRPYSGPTFNEAALASAVGTSFALVVVFIIVLIVVTALYSTAFATRLPHLGVLIIALVVVIMALVALLAPIIIVPNAAATDLGTTVFSSGFWGSAAPFTWGAGLGWWLLLVGVILGALGGVMPFLHRMRQPLPPPPPRQYQIEP